MQKNIARGKVKEAFGNLLHVEFEGNIKQGEICFIKIKDEALSCEVIEINGNEAKAQVFEDTSDIKLDTEVEFSTRLLEAELGPGLLTSIFDGLQNPLEKVAKVSGLFLKRGVYLPSLDREKKWEFCRQGLPEQTLSTRLSIMQNTFLKPVLNLAGFEVYSPLLNHAACL